MFLLKGILFLILLGFIFFLIAVLRLAWSARHLFQMFRSGHTRPQPNDTYGETIQTDDGTVVDRRTSQEANRKIIADNEGEYVEYETIDN